MNDLKRLTTLTQAISTLALIALPVTGYLIYAHYKPDLASFCNFNSTFNCETVNQSVYSEVLGIPVAIMGFLTYLILFGLSWRIYSLLQRTDSFPTTYVLLRITMLLAGFGTAFSLYLTSMEAFVLKTWCIFCMTQQVIILTIFILSLVSLRAIRPLMVQYKPSNAPL